MAEENVEPVDSEQINTITSTNELFEFSQGQNADLIGTTEGEVNDSPEDQNQNQDDDQQNDEGDGAGAGDQLDPNVAALVTQVQNLTQEVQNLTANKAQDEQNEAREAEKAKLKGDYAKLQNKLAILYKNPQRNAGKISELEGQRSIITARAAIIEDQENREKAEKEKKEKESEENKIPEATQKWLNDNQWFNDPRFHQWKGAAQTLADQLANLGYDENSPGFYKAIDDELKRNGFKKPTGGIGANLKGFGLNIKPGGNTNTPPRRGTPALSVPTTKTGKKNSPLKLDRERSEMVKGLGILNDPKAAEIYKKSLQNSK